VSSELTDLFFRPFAHLPQTEFAGAIDLDVELAQNDVRPDFAAFKGEAGFHRDVGGHRIHASSDGRFVWHQVLQSNSLWRLDRVTNRITGWVETPERISLYEKGKPLANLLPFVFESRGMRMIHSGFVSWRDRGFLIAGAGGAGKSTTALACASAGFGFIGEDYVAIEETAPGMFAGHSIYGSVWIAPDHLSRFNGLSDAFAPGGDIEQKKSLLMLDEVFPGRLRSSATIHALILPEVAPGAATTIRHASRPEALKQLGPNCLMTASRVDKKGFENLVRIVETVPAYRLTLGRDLDRAPELLMQLTGHDD
jgi:hypothetical protein